MYICLACIFHEASAYCIKTLLDYLTNSLIIWMAESAFSQTGGSDASQTVLAHSKQCVVSR